MNLVLPSALEAFLEGEVDLLDHTIKGVMVTDAYTFDDAHEFLDDITDTHGAAATFTGKAVTGGRFTAADLTFPAIAAGETLAGLWVYRDTGSAATSRLLAFIHEQRGVPYAIEPTGDDITWQWSSQGVFRI